MKSTRKTKKACHVKAAKPPEVVMIFGAGAWRAIMLAGLLLTGTAIPGSGMETQACSTAITSNSA
ncbi:hypothetical protein D3C85_1657120 [compost metagenome]